MRCLCTHIRALHKAGECMSKTCGCVEYVADDLTDGPRDLYIGARLPGTIVHECDFEHISTETGRWDGSVPVIVKRCPTCKATKTEAIDG